MSLIEGTGVVFEGIGADDAPWPGDAGTVVALAGRGAWVRFATGRAAGSIVLVLAEDLVEQDSITEGAIPP